MAIYTNRKEAVRNPIAKYFYESCVLWQQHHSEHNYNGRVGAYYVLFNKYASTTVMRNLKRIKSVLDRIEADVRASSGESVDSAHKEVRDGK